MRTIKRSAGRKVKPQPTKPKRTIPKRHRIPPPPGGPPGSATDQEQPLVDLAVGGLAIGGASAQKLAQVCTVGATGWLTEVWFPLGCDAGDLIVEVHGVNGNVPDGTILASRSSTAADFSDPVAAGTFRCMSLSSPPFLNSGDQVSLVLRSTGSASIFQSPVGDSYTGGDAFFDARPNPPGWAPLGTRKDLPFRTVMEAPLLKSKFLRTDRRAQLVAAGTSYNMNDPQWLVNISDQNQDIFAYKIFSAFHMLGYDTLMGSAVWGVRPQVEALKAFQAECGFPVSDDITSEVIFKLDERLAAREVSIAGLAVQFPLYDHMLPLHANAVSGEWLAYLYWLPMVVLPSALQPASLYETVACIAGQGVGSIVDSNGNDMWPIDMNADYRFVGAYFDPRLLNTRLPGSTVVVHTVLHEYAHYLDGAIYQPIADQPRCGCIPTQPFNEISFEQITSGNIGRRRSDDPKDFLTKYGFLSSYGCPPGYYQCCEEFADCFAGYVTAGRLFRTAAAQSAMIQQKYDWLKANVFGELEYDTDLTCDESSGCNDKPGCEAQQPGYMSCRETYVWDGLLATK